MLISFSTLVLASQLIVTVADNVPKFNRVFVKSCGWISCKFNRERPVDSGFLEFDRRSDFARESEMISQARYRRRRGTDFGYCDEAAAVA
jgi:hypothetical protein